MSPGVGSGDRPIDGRRPSATPRAYLGLLLVEQPEAAVERRQVREGEVQVRVQPQQRERAEVRRVHVRDDVEQQPHDAPHDALELRRELVR